MDTEYFIVIYKDKSYEVLSRPEADKAARQDNFFTKVPMNRISEILLNKICR